MEPRRSARLTTYDSNGRDALAGDLGWTRGQLETWIQSPSIRPHLQAWYRLCVEGERRFNDAVEWINTGEKGYFYDPRDLEEDVFLACLGEGVTVDGDDNSNKGYDIKDVQTGEWITQELWARTAWRIVQASIGPGEVFEKRIKQHTAWCYAFVIDMLCIAFHSIAHRGPDSCYRDLIVGATKKQKAQWTAGRAAWVENHGAEDSKAEAVENTDSSSMIDESDVQTSSSEDNNAESDTSFCTTAVSKIIMPRTLAALRQQEHHNADAIDSGKVVPLSLTGLKKHTAVAAKKPTSKKQTVGNWLNKVDQQEMVEFEDVVFSDNEDGKISMLNFDQFRFHDPSELTNLTETSDVDMSEASTIILASKKRIADDEEDVGEDIVVTPRNKRVKVAGMGALVTPESMERGARQRSNALGRKVWR